MNSKLFHRGPELFEAFGISPVSEIQYSDCCQELIWPHRGGIRFNAGALLITDLRANDGDWSEARTLRFSPWDNVLSIVDLKGGAKRSCEQIREWLSTLIHPAAAYPLLHIEDRRLSLVLLGTPRSVRSKKGKARLKTDVWSLQKKIEEQFGTPESGPVELMIDIFTTQPTLPDVDRISNSIMDVFVGLTCKDDKQIIHLRPRVFVSSAAFIRLECRAEPMSHYELEDIPAASLFPLAGGIRDYYVVRIRPASCQ